MSDETKRYAGSQGGKTFGYRVETRSTTGPIDLEGRIIGTEWTVLEFPPALKGEGVPNHLYSVLAKEQGLLTYPTAIAMAAWLDCAAGFRACLEFRFVKIQMTYSWEMQTVGFSAPRRFWDEEQSIEFASTPTGATP